MHRAWRWVGVLLLLSSYGGAGDDLRLRSTNYNTTVASFVQRTASTTETQNNAADDTDKDQDSYNNTCHRGRGKWATISRRNTIAIGTALLGNSATIGIVGTVFVTTAAAESRRAADLRSRTVIVVIASKTQID